VAQCGRHPYDDASRGIVRELFTQGTRFVQKENG
jgi:hypothetical protein